MKFIGFKEFREIFNVGVKDISLYLTTDLKKALRDLQVGLTRLSFVDNFESFEVEVTIPATTEVAIPNELKPFIPSQRIVVRGGSGSGNIVDGSTDWNEDYVYLQNTGASSVTAVVLFLR